MNNLRYLPIAEKDIESILLYISEELHSPKAATDLLNALERSIATLRNFPFSGKRYDAVKPLEWQYRVLFVKNYAVFYIVLNDTVEIHRVVYAKMDLPKLFGSDM